MAGRRGAVVARATVGAAEGRAEVLAARLRRVDALIATGAPSWGAADKAVAPDGADKAAPPKVAPLGVAPRAPIAPVAATAAAVAGAKARASARPAFFGVPG